MPSIFDMKTTIGSYGAPEFHLMVAAASEMAAYYSLPFYGTAGCTDAKPFDEQAVAEMTMELFSSVLSKANLVHDLGVMDHCNSISPEMVVLADELISGLKAYSRGIDLSDLPEALDLMKKVGPRKSLFRR
jgi:trimethylamine---corrinoid protein Co-methyltransferase